MLIKLFEIDNGALVLTDHCYTLNFLKDIMDEYPDSHLSIFKYLFYMNPFFHLPEHEKEDIIIEEVKLEESPEDSKIRLALDMCYKLYETPTMRAYMGIKKALDNMATYMANTQITDGRDGNISQIRAVAKDFDSIRQSFKGAYKDLKDEQQSSVRGGQGLAYDQI
jgi:2-hydroxy-3-keto-5-methylthiopentenyl-1-phosphate phosphatase